jgi:hypothetical protein
MYTERSVTGKRDAFSQDSEVVASQKNCLRSSDLVAPSIHKGEYAVTAKDQSKGIVSCPISR